MKTLKLCNINKIVRAFLYEKIVSIYFCGGSVAGFIIRWKFFSRGFSHWSMFVLGGICMMFFSYQGQQVHWQDDFLLQVFRCSIFVTAAEFITGIIVNKWFALHVWDYSCMPFQLFGQICLPYTMLFTCLCAAGIYLSANILYLLYDEEKPQFLKKSILLNSKYKCYNEM